jgi:hypothetical protein
VSDCYRPADSPGTRLQRFARTMRQEDDGFAALAEALSKSADYRVLRGLPRDRPSRRASGKR